MSVIYQNGLCYFIDHGNYINNLYKNVSDINCFKISSNLFSIVENFKTSNKRKRSHNCESLFEENTPHIIGQYYYYSECGLSKPVLDEFQYRVGLKDKTSLLRNIFFKFIWQNYVCQTSKIKQLYLNFISTVPDTVKVKLKTNCHVLPTQDVRNLSKNIFEATVFDHKGVNGGNTSNSALECNIKNEQFLLPPNSRFLCGCVHEQCKKLEGNQFDIIIADPPWWNKYIRRLKSANTKLSYTMMYNEDIASIPVKQLSSPNSLIAVWCTNSPSNIAAVKDLIFPSWGVEYIATWYWLKVTIHLEPICEFGVGSKKQPYERLMLGRVGDVKGIPEELLFISVPSALHSHKPPLLDLFSKFINTENVQILELFARYLLPNTTSVGYEPLKWQHISLYESVS